MDPQHDRPEGPGGDAGPVPYLPPRPVGEDPAPRRRPAWWLPLGALAVLAVLVVLLWPLLAPPAPPAGDPGTPQPTVSRDPDPGLDGIVARAVPPAQVRPGDCLTDLEGVQAPATVVECSREHEAQLVGRKLWPTDRAFPGEGMRAAAEEFCGAIALAGIPDAQVTVEVSHPTEGTWAAGDRRVDCVAVAHDGVLTGSLVEEPAFQDWSDHDDA
ncbi:hypothetical protein E7744_03140 [Citricoccus sp. SGAir0253]|uniref:hypothetical protein n=1 Tax=Citricoccus sp. SGAir0253 TaxID=2567881 RepID=UPI0010CCC951|nr:hypothetical protein [Citricoccus sp. SGAir0253]QCU77321.1 hypothetical protein E7744_03140 [Citricoccus sp. SGAir0253]